MNNITQKDAVYNAIQECKSESGSYNKDDVAAKLLNMYEQGLFEIKSESKKKSEKTILTYLKNTITNWINRDSRLTGAISHEVPKAIKKPADDELKRLLKAKLLLQMENVSTDEIEGLIAERLVEIKETKETQKFTAEENARKLLNENFQEER